MDMGLLQNTVKFNQNGEPTVQKELGKNEKEMFFSPEMAKDRTNRTIEGLKLEAAYRIFKVYKGIEYLEHFVASFLEGSQKLLVEEIDPTHIEHWFDVKLNTSSFCNFS